MPVLLIAPGTGTGQEGNCAAISEGTHRNLPTNSCRCMCQIEYLAACHVYWQQYWEPSVMHTVMAALSYHLYSLALALSPGQPGTFAALGYTQQLMGHLPEAIEAYHSALAIRPDDSFTVDMLNAALEEYSRADL
eukprot:1156845-Pelagomonas_calceolata.AAC.7